tara:strand:+ start:1370 stop:1600 length:231 start_codon:yes stop_codon:yes gene_type:complete
MNIRKDIRELTLSLQPEGMSKAKVGVAVGNWSAKATVPYQAPAETSGKVTYQHNKNTKFTASGNRRGGMLQGSWDF